ncbi:MAG TPA: glycosyltransferase family 4 protein, partial [Microbacterium sp.]|nr:glycosyltransferase family 4 protein [Microbacterium sp.]
RGWDVRTIEVGADAGSADGLAGVPTGATVLVDGLVGIRRPGAIEAAAGRLRVVVLAHMVVAAFPGADPRDIEGEARLLRCARRVITTSEWARSQLVGRGLVAAGMVVAARPGADEGPAAVGSPTGGSLLCVGVIAPHKGQDTLIDALDEIGSGLPWTCTFAGSDEVDAAFAARVSARVERAGLSGRVSWAGVLARPELDAAYARADLLVAPSRAESYGMAVADALGRGLPVLASRVGGIPEAVGAEGGAILVPPEDPRALGEALRRWMLDPALRTRLTDGARRGALRRPRWRDTVDTVQTALAGLS